MSNPTSLNSSPASEILESPLDTAFARAEGATDHETVILQQKLAQYSSQLYDYTQKYADLTYD